MKRIEVRVEMDEDEAREFMDLIQDSRAVLDELLKEVRSLKRKVREVEVAVKDAAKGSLKNLSTCIRNYCSCRASRRGRLWRRTGYGSCVAYAGQAMPETWVYPRRKWAWPKVRPFVIFS